MPPPTPLSSRPLPTPMHVDVLTACPCMRPHGRGLRPPHALPCPVSLHHPHVPGHRPCEVMLSVSRCPLSCPPSCSLPLKPACHAPSPAPYELHALALNFLVTAAAVTLPCPPLQDFARVVVAGDPPFVPPVRVHKPPLDAHMPSATLRLFVNDRVTGG